MIKTYNITGQFIGTPSAGYVAGYYNLKVEYDKIDKSVSIWQCATSGPKKYVCRCDYTSPKAFLKNWNLLSTDKEMLCEIFVKEDATLEELVNELEVELK